VDGFALPTDAAVCPGSEMLGTVVDPDAVEVLRYNMSMTREEYEVYEKSVADFLKREGLANLSSKSSEPFFSWHACECCGDTLGGNREEANGYNPTTKEVQDYEFICEDCIYYVEYGN